MSSPARHRWNVTPAEARRIQERLRGAVVRSDHGGPIRLVAGVDVAFEAHKTVAHAGVVLLRLPDLEVVEQHEARRPLRFPYVPGLLSFRELPVVIAALDRLQTAPDLVMCDGQGYAHPRRLGIASHLGVVTGLRTVGVAKTRLIGVHDEVPDERGAWVPLRDRDERIGVVLRSRVGVRPLYVSVGHRIGLRNAVRQVMRCVTRYRLPEPTRLADRLSKIKRA